MSSRVVPILATQMATAPKPVGVLFVCTGNIFRSLTADVALRVLLAQREDIHVSSAGTDDYPHVVGPYTRSYLLERGFDVSSHRRRTLTREILDASHLVVAMSTDHQAAIRRRFARDVPLFLEVCGEAPEWLPDIEDVIPDYRTNRTAVEAHVRKTIDRIIELAPRMAVNMDVLMHRYGGV
jgi:protein-tyrosine phosphatase